MRDVRARITIRRVRAAVLAMLATGTAGWAITAYAQAPGRSVWTGIYTAEQATRGAQAYAESCAACHGASLAGIDVAPALTGGNFLNNWNGTTTADLFDRIKTTMPLNAPGSLPGRTVADIEAFLFQTNGFPAGAVALPADPAAMPPTAILGTKPAA